MNEGGRVRFKHSLGGTKKSKYLIVIVQIYLAELILIICLYGRPGIKLLLYFTLKDKAV